MEMMRVYEVRFHYFSHSQVEDSQLVVKLLKNRVSTLEK